MTSTQLTEAREALWDAITNWPATAAWKQYNAQGDPNLQAERGPSSRQDLPAVRIMPTRIGFEWQTQRYMNYDYVLDVTIWQKTLGEIEAAAQDLWEAIVRSTPEGETVSYTRAVLAKTPEQLGLVFKLATIGKDSKLLVWSGVMTVGLVTENQPHGS